MNKPLAPSAGPFEPWGEATTFGDGPALYDQRLRAPNARYTGYDDDPALERLAARFAAGFLEEELAALPPGFEGIAKLLIEAGGPKPTARWLRKRLKTVQRADQRPREKKYREGHREQRRKLDADWRDEHKEEFDKLRLSRPFIVLDSEGQDYKGNALNQKGRSYGDGSYKGDVPEIRHEEHGTYLWCASSDDPAKPTHVLVDPLTEGRDKHKLDVKTILDWLLSLPAKYGTLQINRGEQKGAIFILFGSGYDISEILCQTSLRTAHNVVKRVDWRDNDEARDAPEFWGEYAFSYLKGKWFDIWRLRDPDHPINPNGKIDAVEHIKVFDAYGYFQKKFEDVVGDMVDRKMADEGERALIAEMKALRGKFADEDISKITEYCLTECRLLSKQMTQLRDMVFKLDLRPKGWHGPGALASAVFLKQKLGRHFGEHIAATNISEQQQWAQHAFVGGRIESLKQGYLKQGMAGATSLHVYDVASCYPAGMIDLPSLAPDTGKWDKYSASDFRFDDLSEMLRWVEKTSPVSMFRVKWKFPKVESGPRAPARITNQLERQQWEGQRATFIPFYPLPYRTKSGGILFPSSGHSICPRDDMSSAIKWMMKFTPNFPRKTRHNGEAVVFDVGGAWIWEPNEKTSFPLRFVKDMYDQRREIKDEAKRTGVYNPMEMVLKLLINSIYGKFAQFVGERGKVPKTVNPYYAAAITAYGRRRLCEAALIDPHAGVFFATDGYVSTRPIHGFDGGLDRVKVEGKDVIALGDWEYVGADGGLFVGSGIYIYWKYKLDDDGNHARDKDGNPILKPVAKLRGGSTKKYKTNKDGMPWLVENVVPIWEGMKALPGPHDDSGLITRDYKQFITVGSALSPNRWKLAGRWSPEPGEPGAYRRSINAHEMGNKRTLNIYKLDELITNGERPAKRTYELIPTIPRINKDPELSRDRPPDWVDEETGKKVEEGVDFASVADGSRSDAGYGSGWI